MRRLPILLLLILAGCRASVPHPGPGFMELARLKTQIAAERAAAGLPSRVTDEGDCKEPNDPIPDPPGATRTQIDCAMAYYGEYLKCWFGDCAPTDCKCKNSCWNNYVNYRGSVCYPPNN